MMSRFASQNSSTSVLPISRTSTKESSVYIEVGSSNGKSSSENKEIKEVKLLCMDVSAVPITIQFLALTAAVFAFYLIYGYMQELIFRLEEFRPHGWYLTLVQFAYYTGFGLVEMTFSGDRSRKIPLRTYILLAALTVATMGLSNTSVGFLNYPTQVIFKCCKLIPVMIGGVCIQGKRYSPLDVTAMLLMVVGLILFTLADNSISPSFNPYGVLLISLALCADGLIGNYQEKALKQYSAGNAEMVLYSYCIGFVYILVGLLTTGELSSAMEVCKKYPKETYGYAVIFSLSGYLGVLVVLTLVRTFGALMAVTVTTCRKAVTIIISFVFFTKPFTYQYVWSGLIVLLGIYLNVYSKNKSSMDTKMAQLWQRWQNKFVHKLGHKPHPSIDV